MSSIRCGHKENQFYVSTLLYYCVDRQGLVVEDGFDHHFDEYLSSMTYDSKYSRSGFDCEILLIANCEFFHNSQSKESQENMYSYTCN